MEEGLEENTVSVSRSSWKEKRYLSQDYVLELSLQDKNPLSLLWTMNLEILKS